jgi:hypothetical protein
MGLENYAEIEDLQNNMGDYGMVFSIHEQALNLWIFCIVHVQLRRRYLIYFGQELNFIIHLTVTHANSRQKVLCFSGGLYNI